VAAGEVEAALAIGRAMDPVALELQRGGDQVAHRGLVLDQQQFGHDGARGRVTVKVLPQTGSGFPARCGRRAPRRSGG
jgi:hypothetical protein